MVFTRKFLEGKATTVEPPGHHIQPTVKAVTVKKIVIRLSEGSWGENKFKVITRKLESLELTIDGNAMWHLEISVIWSLYISKCVLWKLVPQNVTTVGRGGGVG